MRELNLVLPIKSSTVGLLGSTPNPTIPGYTANSTRFNGNVVVVGNYAYVAGNGSSSGTTIGTTFTIYDISNPALPVALSYIPTYSVGWVSGASYLNGSYQVAIQNNYAYIGSSGSSIFYSINITNPNAPFNVGHLTITNSPGSLYGTAVLGNYAYLATQNKGLTVVDITNPVSMVQTFQEGGTTNKSVGVTVANGYAFTTNYQTASPWTVRYLKIWSLANPAVPVLLTTYTLPAGTKPGFVSVVGNYAYVSDLNTSTIQIIDITNPLSPTYLASMQASAKFNVSNNVQIYENFAYVTSGQNATYGGAIDIFDISNKSAPILLQTITQNVPTDVFGTSYLYKNILYVSDYGTGSVLQSYLRVYSTITSFSTTIPAQNLYAMSVQSSGTINTAAGMINIQVSDDEVFSPNVLPVNWSTVAFSSLTADNTVLLPKTDLSYQYIRLEYNNTGVGDIISTIKALGE